MVRGNRKGVDIEAFQTTTFPIPRHNVVKEARSEVESMADDTKTQASNPGPSAIPPPASAAAPPSPKPAAPARPTAKPTKTRRFFLLTWFGAAWTAFSLSMVAMVLGTLRFLYPNELKEPPSTFKAGQPETYDPGQVVERFKDAFGVWIVRQDNSIFALSTTCTHLGCTPNWLESEQKFKCPCHGSGFRKDGTNFEGPAPRPLERYKIGRAEDGQVLVDKSKKFQKERGEWSDPDASLTL
jgi:cytochrome b6-f complex iron-sulfur subunit